MPETRVASRIAAGVGILSVLLPAGIPTGETPTWSDLQRMLESHAHRMLMQRLAQEVLEPEPFVTDGCSGGLSTGWELLSGLSPAFAEFHNNSPPWESCCIDHDRVYHSAGGAGSAEASYALRLAADQALRECVIEIGARRTAALANRYELSASQISAGYATIADAIYGAVRLGGGPCTGLSWRWGYGYPACF
jgi:hypothetical protein